MKNVLLFILLFFLTIIVVVDYSSKGVGFLEELKIDKTSIFQ